MAFNVMWNAEKYKSCVFKSGGCLRVRFFKKTNQKNTCDTKWSNIKRYEKYELNFFPPIYYDIGNLFGSRFNLMWIFSGEYL